MGLIWSPIATTSRTNVRGAGLFSTEHQNVAIATKCHTWHKPRMTHSLSFRSFNSSEVEQITGLSTTALRDYRRKGFLPPIVGHGRFDAVELCHMWHFRLLLDKGMRPAHSGDAALLCAHAVVRRALQSPDAFEHYDEQRSAQMMKPQDLEAFRKQALAVSRGALPTSQVKFIVSAPRYFVSWTDDQMLWGDRLDPLFEGIPSSAPNQFAVVIDLHRQAVDLLREAGPLVQIGDSKQARRTQEA